VTRSSLLFVLVTALATSVSKSTNESPIKVDVTGLLKYPKKYHGKRVEVFGYWVTSCAHCSDLYPSFEEEQRKPYGIYIVLGDLRRARMPRQFRMMLEKSWGDYDGYVRVTGTFRFTPTPEWVGKPVNPQPAPKPNAKQRLSPSDEVERIIVWGWNGPPEKQVVEITKLEPLGRPIPSKIQEYDWRQMGMTPPPSGPSQLPHH
jgi:hypothetical protein